MPRPSQPCPCRVTWFLVLCACCALLSIEDAKQKAEHDRRVKAAEAQKQSVRQEILGLRKQFQKLVNKARQLPEHLQLSKEVGRMCVWSIDGYTYVRMYVRAYAYLRMCCCTFVLICSV